MYKDSPELKEKKQQAYDEEFNRVYEKVESIIDRDTNLILDELTTEEKEMFLANARLSIYMLDRRVR